LIVSGKVLFVVECEDRSKVEKEAIMSSKKKKVNLSKFVQELP